MATDILFLRYPSEVSLIVSGNSRSLFHKDVWFIHTDQGVYTFRDENGNYFTYSPNKVSLDNFNINYNIPFNMDCSLSTGHFFTKINNKQEIIQIAQQYFRPLAIQRDKIETLVSLRADDMGFYLS